MNTTQIIFLVATTALAAGACGGNAALNGPTDDDGTGGSEPISCELDASGENFDFVVRNVGSRNLRLAFGCGDTLPIELDTSDGARGIGTGNANSCEIGCGLVYDGYVAWGCSDCGPGEGAELGPGETVTIPWDRRIYVAHVAPWACSGNEDGNGCALGQRLAAEASTSGTLTLCNDGDVSEAGYCYGDNQEVIPFSVDLTTNQVVIAVE